MLSTAQADPTPWLPLPDPDDWVDGDAPPDPERANNYYRARYYDPKIGRFISEDPIGFAAGVNFYAYVENNPTNHNDPFGLSSAIGRIFEFRNYLEYPPKPSLWCALSCIPSVFLDDLIVLGVGGGLTAIPSKAAKSVGKAIVTKLTPALAALNLPTYVGCYWVCSTLPPGSPDPPGACPKPQPAPPPGPPPS